MAVIQDLPPELLRRILELLATGWRSQRDLHNASLVNRAWRCPSQQLLFYTMRASSMIRSTNGEQPPPLASRVLRSVRMQEDCAQEQLDLLSLKDVIIEELVLEAKFSAPTVEGVDLSGISTRLLCGIKSLEINARVHGQPEIPRNTKLELRFLTLVAPYYPPLAFFDSLLGAAPSQTQLELQGGPVYPGYLELALRPVLKQISYLRLPGWTRTPSEAGLSPSGSPPAFDLLSFVSSCTSLRSLDLYWCSSTRTRQVISHVRAPIAHLNTGLGEEDMTDRLIALLELLAMTRLKTWTVPQDCAPEAVMRGFERTRWEEACRARGVEPRDERRFFTDYPAE